MPLSFLSKGIEYPVQHTLTPETGASLWYLRTWDIDLQHIVGYLAIREINIKGLGQIVLLQKCVGNVISTFQNLP